MSTPIQAVVTDGVVTDAVLMDAATVEMFREMGFLEVMWPGAVLVDITEVSPQPGIGWTYDGTSFSAPSPPPPVDEPAPAPEPVPNPAPDPAPAAP